MKIRYYDKIICQTNIAQSVIDHHINIEELKQSLERSLKNDCAQKLLELLAKEPDKDLMPKLKYWTSRLPNSRVMTFNLHIIVWELVEEEDNGQGHEETI